MHTFVNMLALIWLVTWKTAVNLFHSIELWLYLAFGATDRQTVSGEVLTGLEPVRKRPGMYTEVYVLLWWDHRWAQELLRQHEKRRWLRDLWQ